MEFSICNLAITWSIRDFEDVIDRIVIDPFNELFQSNKHFFFGDFTAAILIERLECITDT